MVSGIDLKFTLLKYFSIFVVGAWQSTGFSESTNNYLRCTKYEVYNHVCKHVARSTKNVYQDF